MQSTELVSLKNWGAPPPIIRESATDEAIVDCGWGRLLFGQTFFSSGAIARELRREKAGCRDVALYIRDPQVIIAQAPQELFIDPSVTMRLSLQADLEEAAPAPGITIRSLAGKAEIREINRIYMAHGMVPVQEDFAESLSDRQELLALVAADNESGEILGCVTGVDHRLAFDDPDNGSSLWALAVDAQCPLPGVGTALLLDLANRFRQAGRSFMDLSVMHDNHQALTLYKDLGFEQVPVYCVKNRNAINEPLYIGPRPEEELNPYARIITEEASRRGIAVDVVDAATGLFSLSLGGRTIHCRESLTDATSAVAVARCDDKALTRRLLQRGGLSLPEQAELQSESDALEFLDKHSRIVIKPARGEQGTAVAVDLQREEEVRSAWKKAADTGETVLGEQYVEGEDLRVVVIDNEIVAAAVRRPPAIVGTDRHTIRELIVKQSRRRQSATGGESSIPLDDETCRCVRNAGYSMDDVLPAGIELVVRKTANLHTGGTLHDVTDLLHPRVTRAAIKAARILDIPVVGFDFIVPAPESSSYVIIEANERPGLANHEPQPTAAKLLDLLFPTTMLHGGQAS